MPILDKRLALDGSFDESFDGSFDDDGSSFVEAKLTPSEHRSGEVVSAPRTEADASSKASSFSAAPRPIGQRVLPDGRGNRLQLDHVFKGFID
jgi:hypothetical protein